VLVTPSLARAQAAPQGFGQQGQLILSADRLFTLFGYSRVSQDDVAPPPNTQSTTTDTSSWFSFFWGSTAPAESFFTVPRVGLDYTIVPRVTLGGDLVAFFTVGGSRTTDTTVNGMTVSSSTDSPSTTIFGVAPRGGYIIPLNDILSLWLRGGFSFYTSSTKSTSNIGPLTGTTTEGVNQFALDLEPQLVINPIPHFGFTAGLTGDIPLVGHRSIDVSQGNASSSASAGSSILFIGANVGILGWFGPG
jgi:hypothetical protein